MPGATNGSSRTPRSGGAGPPDGGRGPALPGDVVPLQAVQPALAPRHPIQAHPRPLETARGSHPPAPPPIPPPPGARCDPSRPRIASTPAPWSRRGFDPRGPSRAVSALNGWIEACGKSGLASGEGRRPQRWAGWLNPKNLASGHRANTSAGKARSATSPGSRGDGAASRGRDRPGAAPRPKPAARARRSASIARSWWSPDLGPLGGRGVRPGPADQGTQQGAGHTPDAIGVPGGRSPLAEDLQLGFDPADRLLSLGRSAGLGAPWPAGCPATPAPGGSWV